MFKLEFTTGNSAFGWEEGEGQCSTTVCAAEAARIVRELATRLEYGELDGPVFDINGNRVGRFELNGD